MAYATAYSNLLYDQRPLEYQYTPYVSQIVDTKNKLFDNAYRSINSFKDQVINLNLLNGEAQQKVNEYNKKINDYFNSKDLSKMDLADFKIANQLTSIFSEIGNDQTLGLHKQKSDEFKRIQNDFTNAAKNPAKSGYSQANHIVWTNEHLKEYMNGSYDGSLNTTIGNFIPKYDYSKDFKNLLGSLKFDGSKFEVQDKNNPGVTQTIDIKELTPDKINTLLNVGLPAEAINQIMTDHKANAYNAMEIMGTESFAQNTYEQLKNNHEQRQKSIGIKIQNLTGQINATSDNDLKEKLLSEKSRLEGMVEPINISLTEFKQFSPKQIASYYAKVAKDNQLESFARAFSYKIESRTSKVTPGYYQQLAHNLSVRREQFVELKDQRDFQYKMTRDQIEDQKDLAKLELDKIKNNFYLPIQVEGEYTNQKLNYWEIDAQIKEKSKSIDLKEVNVETIKGIKNGTIKGYDYLKGDIDNLLMVYGNNEESYGYVVGKLNESLKSGKWASIKNQLSDEVETLLRLKNDAWNNTVDNLPLEGYSDEQTLTFRNLPREEKNKLIVSRLSDSKFANNFYKTVEEELNKSNLTGKLYKNPVNKDSKILKSLPVKTSAGTLWNGEVNYDNLEMIGNKVKVFSKTDKENPDPIDLYIDIPKEYQKNYEGIKNFNLFQNGMVRRVQTPQGEFKITIFKDKTDNRIAHYKIEKDGKIEVNSVESGRGIVSDDPEHIFNNITTHILNVYQ